jgi:hypothetical protein
MAKYAPAYRRPKPVLKRTLRNSLILFVVLGAAHFGIGRFEHHELQSRIDSLHARGEKVLLEDFSDPDPHNNGAKDITAAAAILDDDSIERLSVAMVPTTRPMPPEAWPYLESAVTWFQPALRRIDAGTAKDHIGWEHHYRPPIVSNLLLPELNRCRAVADLLIVTALVDHHEHHDNAALRRLSQLLVMSHASDNSPATVGHLCALGTIEAFDGRLEQILPDLLIDDANPDAASASEVKSMTGLMLDESRINRVRSDAFASERMSTLDMCQELSANPGWTSYAVDPYFTYCKCEQLDEQTAIESAAKSSDDWPTVNARIVRIPDRSSGFPYISSRNSLAYLIRVHYAALADQRIAATAVAIALYRHDHHNAYPATLEALVTDYLPAVPLDPMAAGSKPIRYLPRDGDPILYSVGFDGVDDQGSEAALAGCHGELNHRARSVYQ